jgi:hypothetical protein
MPAELDDSITVLHSYLLASRLLAGQDGRRLIGATRQPHARSGHP